MSAEQLPPIKPPTPERPLKIPRPTETLTTGKDIIQKMITMTHEAKYSIDFQTYTFEADETGRKILDAFTAAKAKNPDLKIRFVVDNSISFRHDSSYVGWNGEARKKRDETYELLNKMKEDGIFEDVKITNWFPQNPVINAIHLYSNILHRDHKKLMVVDGRDYKDHPDAEPQALVTSANVAKYHEFDRKELGRVYHGTEGPVPYLESDFDYTFHHAQEWGNVYSVRSVREYIQKYGVFGRNFGKDFIGSIVRNPLKPGERMVFREGSKGHDSAVLTDSLFGKFPAVEKLLGRKLGAREATDELFSMLDLAKPGDSVIAFTPYPGIFTLTHHLTEAAKRGVDVHLIISQNYENELINPKKTTGWNKVAYAFFANWPDRLTKSGVVLHEYKGEKEGYQGVLHAKGAVLMRSDGTARTLIGSTNFSKGPMSGLNREIAVVEESDALDPLVTYARDLIADSDVYTPSLRRGIRRNR